MLFAECERLDRQRLIFGIDDDLDISPGLPPERCESAARAAVADEGVADAVEEFAVDGVAVAFDVAGEIVIQRFGPEDADDRIRAAGDAELGEGAEVVAEI